MLFTANKQCNVKFNITEDMAFQPVTINSEYLCYSSTLCEVLWPYVYTIEILCPHKDARQ
jgi:hypothetical protein